jgi:L-ascorbate metabolism protein UlaG (beta-lactamase superfamily)
MKHKKASRPLSRPCPSHSSFRLYAVCSLAALLLAAPQVPAAVGDLVGDRVATSEGDLIIHPVNHASFVLNWNKLALYNDPVGGGARYAGLPRADLILLTDIHGDHLDVATLKTVATDKTRFIASAAAAEQLPAEWRERTTVLTNGQSATVAGVQVEAMPAYNLAAERQRFHPKGRGNGYILLLGGKRVYISGDTEDIPEMRGLKNIDVAFLCMNLPYTMDVEHAAQAVREFRPKIVYPYHYRGSDLEKFKKLVGEDVGVEVRLREWYGRQ